MRTLQGNKPDGGVRMRFHAYPRPHTDEAGMTRDHKNRPERGAPLPAGGRPERQRMAGCVGGGGGGTGNGNRDLRHEGGGLIGAVVQVGSKGLVWVKGVWGKANEGSMCGRVDEICGSRLPPSIYTRD